MSTIVAIATPLGVGGIGIVRLSGGDALRIARNIFAASHIAPNSANIRENVLETGANFETQNTDGKEILKAEKNCSPSDEKQSGTDRGESLSINLNKTNYEFGSQPNLLVFGTVKCEEFSDKGYAVYFKAPRSYTGEDVVEFQLHGGHRILDGVVLECIKQGATAAQRGEFTKRAYLNGKLTLADAEGVIDMINAESAAAVRAAYRLLCGEFGNKISEIENRLLNLISGLEASLDYPDEMEDEVLPKTPVEIDTALNEIDTLLSSQKIGRFIKYGPRISLVGKSNVGKSSLLNALVKSERAIVTDIAGTTRDLVSESIEYKGMKLNFVDTAGLRESGDEIEKIGIKLAGEEIEKADLILYVIEQGESADNEFLKRLKGKEYIVVENKADLGGGNYGKAKNIFKISAKYKEGLDALLDEIYSKFAKGAIESGEIVTSQRHYDALQRTYDELMLAKNAIDLDSIDCILISLRAAADALGEITGTTASEEIVDRIFANFCVGK